VPAIKSEQRVLRASFSGTLRTTGIAESAMRLLGRNPLGEPAMSWDRFPLAYLPGVAGVDLRVTVKGLPRDRAEKLVRKQY